MQDLIDAIRSKSAVLFAGAGLSVELGAPTWKGLIEKMANDLGYNPDILSSGGATPWALAEFYKLEKGTIGPLRSWMDKEWNASEEDIKASKAHTLISELGFNTIYTTNYDSNIERALKLNGINCRKISSVKDFRHKENNETIVIKFHGDFDDDNSIVITESDYFDRLQFESPLDVRLRSDAIGKTVLFVGYSLSDINTRLLLYKLWKTWKDSEYESERPKSYIFLTRPDAVNEAVLRNWGVEPVISQKDEPSLALIDFLEDLKSKTTGIEEATSTK